MKLRAANPVPGWQVCLEAEALPPISARLAARQGQLPGSAAAQLAQPAQQPPSAFSGAAQAPAFGHASSAPKTVPGRHLNPDKQGTGSLLHLPGLSTLLNEGKCRAWPLTALAPPRVLSRHQHVIVCQGPGPETSFYLTVQHLAAVGGMG